MRKLIMVTACLVVLAGTSFAEETKDRRWYRDTWCTEHQGTIEYEISDRMIADCVTETHAVRVDFGNNWTQALGFALHYGMKTGKRGGVVLILDQSKDYMHWIRLNSVIEHYKLPLDAWYVDLDKAAGSPSAPQSSESAAEAPPAEKKSFDIKELNLPPLKTDGK